MAKEAVNTGERKSKQKSVISSLSLNVLKGKDAQFSITKPRGIIPEHCCRNTTESKEETGKRFTNGQDHPAFAVA